jgi:histidine ammonia-lyase
LGIELLLAAQAVEMNEGLELSPAGSETLSGLREHVPHLREDRPLSDDMERARACFVERASKWRRTLL